MTRLRALGDPPPREEALRTMWGDFGGKDQLEELHAVEAFEEKVRKVAKAPSGADQKSKD